MKNMIFKNIVTVLMVLTAGTASAATEYVASTTTEASFTGVADFDYAGYAIANAGDVNCDGIDDMLIGAPYQNSDDGSDRDVGKVYLVYGASGSSVITGDQNLADTAGAIFTGEGKYDKAGSAVSTVGDVNGDGCDDFLIGAPGYDNGNAYTPGKGAVYLFYGGSWSGNYSVSDASVIWVGNTNDLLGTQVAAAGDVNGDGYDDMLLHARGYSSSVPSYEALAGKAYLIYGGTSVAMDGGELNPSDTDTEICSTEGSTTTTCAVFTGVSASNEAGREMAHGDINADGYDDILISAPGASRTYLFYGSRTKLSGHSLSNASAQFIGAGDSVCTGDVTGDGKTDFVLANKNFSSDTSKTYQGRGYIIKGDPSFSILKRRYSGRNWLTSSAFSGRIGTFSGAAYDEAGYSLSCGGDANGDGADDILIGAQAYNLFTSKTYLLYGDSSLSGDTDLEASSSVTSFTQESTYAEMGYDVDISGDYDGDGLSDLLMSAVQTYVTASDGPGITYLYYGF